MPIMGLRGFARAAWRQLVMPGVNFSESAPAPIDRVISLAFNGAGGTKVTRAVALSVPAVTRSRNLVCGISTLPLRQIDAQRNPVDSPLLDQLDPNVPNVVTMAQTVEDLYFDAISWWQITETDAAGFPTSIKHLDVNTVSLQPPGNGKAPNPLPSEQDPREASVWINGVRTSARKVIRFDSPLPGLLSAGRRAVRRAIFLDEMAELYAKNPRPLDYFTPNEDADPVDDGEIKELLTGWNEARKEGTTAYVPAALTYNTVDVPSPADLQLLPQQDRTTREIANLAGLDPEDFGVSTTSRTYQNAIDRRQDRINETLAPFMRAITDRLSMDDVTVPGNEIIFVLDEYLRADPKTRAEVQGVYLDKGVIDPEEVRKVEQLPAGAPKRPEVRPVVDNVRPLRASAQFDADGHRFIDVPVYNFAVDVERRTIEGVVVPHGEVATKFWRKYEFAPGALQTPSDLGRNKMLRDHMYSMPLGKLIFHERRADGDFARYKIASGPEGDRALALAAEGVLDGLSVGVDWDDAADTVPHPTKKGVTLVRRADWRETSLTAMPSFDGARVTKVTASATDGGPMQCPICGHVHAADAPHVTAPAPTPAPAAPAPAAPAPAAPAPYPVNFGGIDPAAFMAAFAAAGGHLPAVPAPAAPAPAPAAVNPAAMPAPAGGAVEVSDPVPYVFDRAGNLRRGSHEFSSDLRAAELGDAAARERATTWISEQFDATNTTDTATLNPSRNRPDMYVDQREYKYPVWEAINKGSLTDITPFIFPKFSSASGLVGAHTEGTEPTVGDIVATSQTVTPTAISGKAEINREVWDQGGNPQISNLIWRQMVRGWYESLEAAAVAVLDAATPTGITLTTGGGTTGQTLAAELVAAFAALQYVRGGFTMDNLFAQIDLYKAVVGAKDADGAYLFPALGPANRDGTVRTRFGAVDINGVLMLPAWALAATGSVAASSYLFDSDVVHGWASAPQRLDFNYQVKSVFIGVWGYKATAISDITGVREVIYDPV